MTNKQALRTDQLIANALETAKQLRELQESPVADAIFESIIENENGKEIQFERPISDLAFAAFWQMEKLVDALEAVKQDPARWFKAFEKAVSVGARYEEQIEELTGKLEAAEKRIAELKAKLQAADKLQDSAFRHGLQHGFSLGQTDDQSGFEQTMNAYSQNGIRINGEG